MIQGRINIVDTDRIDTELLHEGGVTETVGTVAQGVTVGGGSEGGRTAGLVAGKSVSGICPALERATQRTQHQGFGSGRS